MRCAASAIRTRVSSATSRRLDFSASMTWSRRAGGKHSLATCSPINSVMRRSGTYFMPRTQFFAHR